MDAPGLHLTRVPGMSQEDIPSYMVEALRLVEGITGWQDLPTSPPIIKVLPSSKSTTFKIVVNSILGDLFACLKRQYAKRSDERLFGQLLLLLSVLPRFLFAGPLREGGRKGDLVSVFKSPLERVLAFKEKGGPYRLWSDSVKMASFYDVKIISMSKEEVNHNEGGLSKGDVDRIVSLLSDGNAEISKASRIAFSDFSLHNFTSEEEVKNSFYSKYNEGDVANPELEARIKRVLSKEYEEGRLKRPGDDGFESSVSRDAIKKYLRDKVPSDQPDILGWRDFSMKQIISWDSENASLFEWLCDIILTGGVPEAYEWLFASFSFMVLDHRVNDKQRVITPSASNIGKMAASAHMGYNKRSLKEKAGPAQMGFGVSSGAIVGAHALKIISDDRARLFRGVNSQFVQVVSDARGFFYQLGKSAWVDALIEAKEFRLLQAAVVQVGNQNGSVIARTTGRKKVVFVAPYNGLPVGHPMAPYLASLPVSMSYSKALSACAADDDRFSYRYERFLYSSFFFDDFHFSGSLNILITFLRELIPRMGDPDNHIASFSPEKGFMKLLSSGDFSSSVAQRLCTALFGTRKQQEEFFRYSGAPPVDVEFTILGKGADDGCKFLGGYVGGVDYLQEKAEQLATRGENLIARLRNSDLSIKHQLSILHSFPAKFSHVMGINGASPEFLSAWQHLDDVIANRICEMAGAVEGEDWSVAQRIHIRVPLRDLGLGIRSVQEIGPIKFLCGYAALVSHVRDVGMGEDALLVRAVVDVFNNQSESSYGVNLGRCISYVRDLFELVNKRPLSKEEDGFDLLDLDDFPSARLLGNLGRKLVDVQQKMDLEDNLPPERLELVVSYFEGSIYWRNRLVHSGGTGYPG